MSENELNWKEAEAHLEYVLKSYGGLLGMPNVNPFFALGFIMAVRNRFDSGERTEKLHADMMRLE